MNHMSEATFDVVKASEGKDPWGIAPDETRSGDGIVYTSHSALVEHRMCPQRWYYSHVRKLEKYDPEDPGVEKDMGSWWHLIRAADSLERGRQHGSLQRVPDGLEIPEGISAQYLLHEDATPNEVMRLADTWWKHQPSHVREAWDARLGEGLPERLSYVYDRWQSEWASELAMERPLAVELRWERSLPPATDIGGRSYMLNAPEVILVGYVDEIYRDTRRNIVVARDHKAPKTLDAATVADDMMDSQLQFYAWGAAPIVHSWGQGKIKATGYDRVRTKKPTTPVVTQMGSLSKSVSDFDLYTYQQWAASQPRFSGRKADGSQAGVYKVDESMLEKLDSPSARLNWFQRTLTPLNANLILVHLRAAVDSAMDMALSYARAQATNEAARNLTKACRYCPFVGLCRSEMVGGSGGFELEDFHLRVKKPRR
jgi:hypothetical protein